MSCLSCQQKQSTPREPFVEATVDCPYSELQLATWQRLLLCAKEKGVVESDALLRAIGIILSALRYRADLCYFRSHLDQISPLIQTIINTEQCQ